jgi:hypothetical protein
MISVFNCYVNMSDDVKNQRKFSGAVPRVLDCEMNTYRGLVL